MACAGCEARREWIKRQTERAKHRMQLCMQRLAGQTDRTEQSVNKSKQSTDSDQQRTERSDQRAADSID